MEQLVPLAGVDMRRVRWPIQLIACTLFAAGSATYAQAMVSLDPNLTIAETYVDNLFFTGSDRQDDFFTLIAPSVTLGYESRNFVIRGTYTGNLQLFANNPDENFFAHNSSFFIDVPGLTQRYRGLEIQLIWSFNFTPQLEGFSFAGEPGQQSLLEQQAQLSQAQGEPIATQAAAPTGGAQLPTIGGTIGQTLNNQGIFTTRNNSFQNLAGFNMSYAWTPRVTPTLRYENYLTFFDSDNLQDSVQHRASVGVGYGLSASTQLRTGYLFDATQFEGDGSGAAQAGAADFVTHNWNVGASHQLTRRSAISGDAGISILDPQTGDTTTRFTGIIRFDHEYPGGTFSIGAQQFIGSGGGLAATATLSQNLIATIDHRFDRTWSGYLLFGFARNDSLSSRDIDTFTFQGGTGLRISLLSWLDAMIDYSYINQDSRGVFGQSAQRNLVSVGLRAVAPTWRLLD